MIKYNMNKILTATEGDPTAIMTIIHIMTYKIIPSSHRDKTFKYYGKSFYGNSFLLNPRQLLVERKNYSNLEAAIYVQVASHRNYFEYKRTGDTTLPLIHLPMLEDIINNNRLLQMKDGVIHFKFEDNAKWKKEN